MCRPVLINARPFGRKITGVERYTREITTRLQIPLKLVGIAAPLGMAGHLWEQIILPRKVKAEDILWSPANIGPISVPNQVVSIHDLSALDHPEWFSAPFAVWYRALYPKLIHIAKSILTVSLYSKIRIQTAFRISDAKITVVPCGVDRGRFRPKPYIEVEHIRSLYRLPRDYALFVGTIEPRKNLSRLLEAWKLIAAQVSPLQLVLAGEPLKHFQGLKEWGRAYPGVRWIGRVAESHLPGLYSGARLFILPSMDEGFGLPVLEAMACGIPVIAAKAGALPEVVGEAGILVNPYDVEAIALAILRLSNNAELRQSLICSGWERVEAFTWERSAKMVRQVIEQARGG